MINWIPARNVQFHGYAMKPSISKMANPKTPAHLMANIITIFIPNLFHDARGDSITIICFHIDRLGTFDGFFIAAIGVVCIALMTADSLKFVREHAVERCSSRFGHVDCTIDNIGVHVSSGCKK